MKNLMIDLETMGNKPNAAIVSIGAVFFDPATGEIGAQYSSPVLLASEITHSAAMDADTIIWWLQQSIEARATIVSGKKSILVVLHELSIFVSEHSTARSVQVWGNGASFDNVILRSAYQRIGHPEFWPFWCDRDVRTVVELGRQIGIDPKRDTPFTGERHDALADAIHQAKYVSVIWQRLIQKTVQPAMLSPVKCQHEWIPSEGRTSSGWLCKKCGDCDGPIDGKAVGCQPVALFDHGGK